VKQALGERARDLLARLEGMGDPTWHINSADHETLVELAEKLNQNLPLDAFRRTEPAKELLRLAVRALDA
jgi:hypothetical protein